MDCQRGKNAPRPPKTDPTAYCGNFTLYGIARDRRGGLKREKPGEDVDADERDERERLRASFQARSKLSLSHTPIVGAHESAAKSPGYACRWALILATHPFFDMRENAVAPFYPRAPHERPSSASQTVISGSFAPLAGLGEHGLDPLYSARRLARLLAVQSLSAEVRRALELPLLPPLPTAPRPISRRAVRSAISSVR
ncbi:RNA binding protein [Rhodotorula toruloides ATCC 204091]|nr:RNA binding protein [Rhodotorula toruloides ATCC 204091]